MGQISHPNLGSPNAMVTAFAELVTTGSQIIKGFIDTSGAIKNLLWNADAPQICSQDYLMALAEGDILGHIPFSKYGIVSGVQNVEVDVWPVNQRYVFPSIGSNMRVVTSNLANGPGSVGALSIHINYLDSNYKKVSEVLSLNGVTPVVTAGSDIFRVNSVHVETAGASGTTIGSIIIYHFSGTQIYGMIDNGFTQTRQLIYTVPSGQTLYLTSVRYSSGQGAVTNKENYCIFRNRANWDGLDVSGGGAIFYPYNEIGLLNQAFVLPLELPTKLPQKTDLKISVVGDTTQDAICTAALRGWLE